MDPSDRHPLAPLLASMGDLPIDPADTALLVVDLQYFDAHRDWGEGRTAQDLGVADRFEPYFEQIDAAVPQARRLLDAFRAAGAEVAHVRVAERTDDSRDVAPKQLLRGLIVPADSQEARFLEEVAPEGDELVFDKSSSGMFPATNVDRMMRNLGVRTLVFCGTSTGGCVESAVRDAVDLGYRVVLVDDACAASTPQDHAAAVDRMRAPTYHVARTDDVVAALRSAPARDRQAVAGTERVKPYLPHPDPDAPVDADPYDLIFPPPKRVDVARADTALLVLDATPLATDPDGPLLRAARAAGGGPDARFDARAARALDHLVALIEGAHRAGLQVLHVRTASRTRDGRDLAPAWRAVLGTLPAGDPATELHPSLPRHDDDIVLAKPGQGPFTGTGLDDLLRHLGVTKLVLAGFSTLGAVEAALRGATDRGYQVLLAPDACASATERDQRRLHGMGAGLIEVVDAAEAVARVAAA